MLVVIVEIEKRKNKKKKKKLSAEPVVPVQCEDDESGSIREQGDQTEMWSQC